MRGMTASGLQEVLNFGVQDGYAYRMTEFDIYPSEGASGIGNTAYELTATVTAAKTYASPSAPNFNDEGLIATSYIANFSDSTSGIHNTIVNDTFLITQNLILAVLDTTASNPMAINWQCRFTAEKMSDTELANANLRQFHVFDG